MRSTRSRRARGVLGSHRSLEQIRKWPVARIDAAKEVMGWRGDAPPKALLHPRRRHWYRADRARPARGARRPHHEQRHHAPHQRRAPPAPRHHAPRRPRAPATPRGSPREGGSSSGRPRTRRRAGGTTGTDSARAHAPHHPHAPTAQQRQTPRRPHAPPLRAHARRGGGKQRTPARRRPR